jgi:hypothetical protein
VSVDIRDRYKIDALLKEYTEIRSEIRVFEVLEIIFIAISALTFAALFTIGVLSYQYILIFISPSFSIFFLIVAMAMLAYTTNLGILSTQVESKLRKIIGEATIEWEYVIGAFGGVRGNIMNIQVGRYWVKFSLLAVIEGIAPVVFGLYYGFGKVYNQVGNVAWFIIGFYIIITSLTIYIGFRFYTRSWERLKSSVLE